MSTMEVELVASALAMKEAVFCSNMLAELGFGKEFAQVPLYCDNTAALHALGTLLSVRGRNTSRSVSSSSENWSRREIF